MFKLFISAQTMVELKSKLLEAAHSIDGPGTPADLPWPEPARVRRQPQTIEDPGVSLIAEDDEPSGPINFGDVDSKGTPYDPRIHSATKATCKDGSWRYRRNVDEGLVKRVEAELAGARAVSVPSAPIDIPAYPMASPPAPVTTNVIPLPPVSNVVVPMPTFQTPPPVIAYVPPQPEPAPQPVAPAQYENIPVPQGATKPAHTLETFKVGIIQVMGALLASGTFDRSYVQTLCNYFGVQNIWEVAKDEAKAKEMFDSLCTNGFITRVD